MTQSFDLGGFPRLSACDTACFLSKVHIRRVTSAGIRKAPWRFNRLKRVSDARRRPSTV